MDYASNNEIQGLVDDDRLSLVDEGGIDFVFETDLDTIPFDDDFDFVFEVDDDDDSVPVEDLPETLPSSTAHWPENDDLDDFGDEEVVGDFDGLDDSQLDLVRIHPSDYLNSYWGSFRDVR